MSFTTPPSASVGGTVTVGYTNTFRDNDLWFNGLLPAPSAANQIPISSSGTVAVWGLANSDQIAAGAITETIIGAGAATGPKLAAGAVTEPKLSAVVALGLSIAGMVAWVRQISEIPSGWSRETNLNGRYPIGAGQTFGVTFVEATDYGSSRSHNHTVSDTSDATGSIQPNLKNDDGGWPASNSSHTHALSGATDLTAWQIPSRGVVYIRKDA